MTTAAYNPIMSNSLNAKPASFAPMEKPTRQVVKEEIQRQKKLDALEEKYKNGEISKLQYNIEKAVINTLPPTTLPIQTSCSLDGHKVGCVANHKMNCTA